MECLEGERKYAAASCCHTVSALRGADHPLKHQCGEGYSKDVTSVVLIVLRLTLLPYRFENLSKACWMSLCAVDLAICCKAWLGVLFAIFYNYSSHL